MQITSELEVYKPSVPYVTTANSFIQLRRYIAESNAQILGKKKAQKTGESLTLLESKILDFLLSCIPPDATTLETIDFNIADYWRACNINPNTSKTYFSTIADTLQRLRARCGYIKRQNPQTGEPEIVLVGFISKVVFRGEDYKHCQVDIDPELAPALISLSSDYTKTLRSERLRMESIHGYALFCLLCSYEYLNAPLCFEVEDLAERLDATTYLKSGDFRRKVIDVAVADINKNSQEIQVSYKAIKPGRSYTHFEFEIHRHSGQCASVGDASVVIDAKESAQYAKQAIRQQIGYDDLSAMLQDVTTDATILSTIVDIIYDVQICNEETIRVGGTNVATQEVQKRYRLLTNAHVALVIEKILHIGDKINDIKNMRSYIRTTLYNADETLNMEKVKRTLTAATKKQAGPQKRELDEDEILAIQRILADPTL